MKSARSKPAWRRYARFWGSNVEEDVDDELQFHLEMRTQEYVMRGLSPDAARRMAEQRFGNPTRARAECVTIGTDARRLESRADALETFIQDVRYAWRLLRRQWLSASLAIGCLALGIGATTTMFSVANALLIRALPFGNGDQLYTLSAARSGQRATGVISYLDYLDWRARQHSFNEVAAYGPTSFAVVLREPVRVNSALVSANFFRTLGVTPVRGRLFADGEDKVDAPAVAVVSRGFAERELGGADAAIGRTIDVRGIPRTIIGVVPDEHALPSTAELWLPIPRDIDVRRGWRMLNIIGWLKPTVTLDQARADLAAIQALLAQENPQDDAHFATSITPLRERFVGSSRPMLFAMLGAALLVLLVACANVASIQLARSTARVREISVRSAMGASRGRVFRQMLTESCLLALAGGLAGVFVAIEASSIAMKSVIGGNGPAWMQAGVDPRVLAFALIVSMLTGVLFGVAPAVRLTRVDPADVLRGGRSNEGPRHARLQQTFVIGQLALSIVLLVGATMSIQCVRNLQRIPLGFNARNVLVFNVTMQGPPFDDEPASRARVASQILEPVRSLPGVTSAGATSLPPLRCCSQWQLEIADEPNPANGPLMVTGNSVTPGYFAAMGVALLKGRDFSSADDEHADAAIIINQTFAERFWPRGDALGHRIRDSRDHAIIVGIVHDVKQGGVLDSPEAQFYRPLAQKGNTTLTFAVRVRSGDPTTLVASIRAIVHDITPRLPVYGVTTMQARVDEALLDRRTFEQFMLVFGLVALLLTSAGVFAVTSFLVARRMREFGVRAALGAEPGQLLAYVLRGSAALSLVGGAIGLALAIAAARWLARSLYGVDADQPLLFITAAAALTAIAFAAAMAPARRASAADPMVALRAD